MSKCRQINILLFAVFVVTSTCIMYFIGADFLGKQEKPWHLQPSVHEDSLSQKYLATYSILGKDRLIDQWKDSSKAQVVILVDGWGVPIDEKCMQQEFSFFENIPHKFAIHHRLANRTKHAEFVEFRNNDTTSIYIFGGDPLEYGRTEYIPTLGFKEVLYCSKCSDSTMAAILDTLIDAKVHGMIAWTTQDTKFGDKDCLQKTLSTISELAIKHSDTKFIIQGSHRPTLGSPETRRLHKSHWVPAILLNP